MNGGSFTLEHTKKNIKLTQIKLKDKLYVNIGENNY